MNRVRIRFDTFNCGDASGADFPVRAFRRMHEFTDQIYWGFYTSSRLFVMIPVVNHTIQQLHEELED